VDGKARYAAALLLLATPFYTFLAYRYNANTIFISLWPWTLYFFVRSIDYMKVRDALLFGLFAAACILSKYYAVTILITCALSLFFHPNGRRYILSPLPWAAAALFALCVSPHLIWSLQNGSPAVAYAMSRTGKEFLDTIEWASYTLIDSAAYHVLVAVIILGACWWSRSRGPSAEQPALPRARRKFLAALALTPPVLTAIFALLFSLKGSAIMALGAFPLVPLFIMQLVPRLDAERCFRLALAWALTITIGAAAASPLERAIMARAGSKPAMVQPRRELAKRATGIWRSEMGVPLRYAGGTAAYADGIAFYSEDHPSSFEGLEFERAEWVTPAKLKQYGLLIACPDDDAACLKRAPQFLSGKWKEFSIGIKREIGSLQTPEVRFKIFTVPPQASSEALARPGG
jgi:Dolichyl-phosphate-mannose-protein mannosyltransferase